MSKLIINCLTSPNSCYTVVMKKNEAKKIAKLHGFKKFYDGIPCKNGHLSERYTRNSACVKCAYTRKTVSLTKEQIKEKINLYQKKYSMINALKKRQRTKQWAIDNPEKSLINAKISQANRRARKLNATPIWADKQKIKQIYKNCPVGYDVDHIIPLGGKLACGLHVESNLQYMESKQNKIKAAKFLP